VLLLRFLPLLWANLRRRRMRTILTIGSVAVAFLLFGLLEALRYAIQGGVDMAGADRLMTSHKISFILPLPRSYLTRVRGIDGVRAAMSYGWFGGVYQEDRNQVIAAVVDQDVFFDVYPEITLNAPERAAWLADRSGAIVGKSLAAANGWKVGNRIPLRSNIYRRRDGTDTWELTIDGIFDVSNGGDTNGLFLRYDYFNESLSFGRDTAGMLVIRVRDPSRMRSVARQVDAMFANSNFETKTDDERAFAQAFINQIGNVGAIISGILSAVFFTMLLVTANTMAQSIRERTAELAVMKTLGFSGPQMLSLVLGESLLITVLGGGLGLLFARVAVAAVRPALQQYLPLFQITGETLLLASAAMVLLGLVAGAAPALQAWRLNIITALRRA
jgi:putative ABC transport system permease protein